MGWPRSNHLNLTVLTRVSRNVNGAIAIGLPVLEPPHCSGASSYTRRSVSLNQHTRSMLLTCSYRPACRPQSWRDSGKRRDRYPDAWPIFVDRFSPGAAVPGTR